MATRIGDIGDEVAAAQELLRWHGFRIKTDRRFGPATQKAVKAFQRREGLKPDGVVGPKTSAALIEDALKEIDYETDGDVESSVSIRPGDKPSRHTWCFDNGHGGVISGVYQTKGKRSPNVPPGIYEGEFNRDVVKRIMGLCHTRGIDCVDLVPEQINISLTTRIKRANAFQRTKGNCIYISVHANAFGAGEWNRSRGIRVFSQKHDDTHKRASVKLARILQKKIVAKTGLRDRGARRAGFFVLRKTNMPAVLSENGFMTHLGEAKLLASDGFRADVAAAHFEMIRAVESGKVKLG